MLQDRYGTPRWSLLSNVARISSRNQHRGRAQISINTVKLPAVDRSRARPQYRRCSWYYGQRCDSAQHRNYIEPIVALSRLDVCSL